MALQRNRRVLLAAGAAGLAGAWFGIRELRRVPARERARARLPAIGAALHASGAGTVFLAGNSHAELTAAAAPQASPWTGIGINGIEAGPYATLLEQVTAPAAARAAVLILGTNDIRRLHKPMLPATQQRFRVDVIRVVFWLKARAGLVLVAAVPPIGATAEEGREPAAVAVYSEILEEICQGSGCRFVDPFAELRGADGIARPGAMAPDGVHVADYAALLAALGSALSVEAFRG